ncbi:MAG: lipoate--protein ligase family protein [Planctomycetes bacterium]|nr:lipoate--protein ligase family protein [Planctomycetota bacterium]
MSVPARPVRWLVDGPSDPAWNLAFDEVLLHGGGATVRVYGWSPPGLSLGYFQEYAAIDRAPFEAAGFVVVRRPTGGGAIAHRDELTFCIADDVLPEGAPGAFFTADVAAGYRRVHAAFERALARLGAASRPRGDVPLPSDELGDRWLCFHKSSAVDLVASGRKLLGSAQRRIGRRVMHHGSLPLGRNPLTPGAVSVGELLGRVVPFAEMADALRCELATEFGIELAAGAATADERASAAKLVATKYRHAEWTRRR